MFKRNMFKVLLLSILCFGTFGGFVMNAVSTRYEVPKFSADEQEAVKSSGLILRGLACGGDIESVKFFLDTLPSDEFRKAVIQDEDLLLGDTPFLIAAAYGHAKVIKKLASYFEPGSDALKKVVMHKNKSHNTPLMLASCHGCDAVVAVIIELFTCNKKALKEIVMQQHVTPDFLSDTVLMKAVFYKRDMTIKILLEPFLDDFDSLQEVLMQVATKGLERTALIVALKKGNRLSWVELLSPFYKRKDLLMRYLKGNLALARSLSAKGQRVDELIVFFERFIYQLKTSGDRLINPTFICGFCHAQGAGSLCSKCRDIGYCDETCQRAHWKTHKVSCREAVAAAAALDAAMASGSGGASSSH